MNPRVAAATDAMLSAIAEPGCLVRVTCSSADETADVVGYLVAAAHLFGLNPRVGKSPGSWPTLEMSNGSGIEVVLEATRRAAGP